MEAVVQALRREPREERDERLGLVAAGSVEPERRAVAQQDVPRDVQGSTGYPPRRTLAPRQAYPALMETFVGTASFALAAWTSRTPFWNVAVILPVSTFAGSAKRRSKLACSRSFSW